MKKNDRELNEFPEIKAVLDSKGLSGLTHLDLSGLSLTRLPSQFVFQTLPSLVSLNLSNNRLQNLNTQCIVEGVPHLTDLNLEGNLLGSFDTILTFDRLQCLQSLNLLRNPVIDQLSFQVILERLILGGSTDRVEIQRTLSAATQRVDLALSSTARAKPRNLGFPIFAEKKCLPRNFGLFRQLCELNKRVICYKDILMIKQFERLTEVVDPFYLKHPSPQTHARPFKLKKRGVGQSGKGNGVGQGAKGQQGLGQEHLEGYSRKHFKFRKKFEEIYHIKGDREKDILVSLFKISKINESRKAQDKKQFNRVDVLWNASYKDMVRRLREIQKRKNEDVEGRLKGAEGHRESADGLGEDAGEQHESSRAQGGRGSMRVGAELTEGAVRERGAKASDGVGVGSRGLTEERRFGKNMLDFTKYCSSLGIKDLVRKKTLANQGVPVRNSKLANFQFKKMDLENSGKSVMSPIERRSVMFQLSFDQLNEAKERSAGDIQPSCSPKGHRPKPLVQNIPINALLLSTAKVAQCKQPTPAYHVHHRVTRLRGGEDRSGCADRESKKHLQIDTVLNDLHRLAESFGLVQVRMAIEQFRQIESKHKKGAETGRGSKGVVIQGSNGQSRVGQSQGKQVAFRDQETDCRSLNSRVLLSSAKEKAIRVQGPFRQNALFKSQKDLPANCLGDQTQSKRAEQGSFLADRQTVLLRKALFVSKLLQTNAFIASPEELVDVTNARLNSFSQAERARVALDPISKWNQGVLIRGQSDEAQLLPDQELGQGKGEEPPQADAERVLLQSTGERPQDQGRLNRRPGRCRTRFAECTALAVTST